MMDGLKLSIPQRMGFLRVVLILSLLISILLSVNLWGGYRLFPYVPVVKPGFIEAPYDVILTIGAVLCWLAALFLRKERLFIFLAFAFCVALVLLDLNRLQPWFYIYNSLLVVYIFYNGRVDDPNKFTSIFIILQLIFAAVYFYCGLSQLNSAFIENSFYQVIDPLQDLMSERQFLFFKKMGRFSPYLLMFIGVGFTVSPLRYIAISLALCMHLLLLIFLFPSALHTTLALWFSNLSFMVMLLLLFSGKTKQRYFSPTFLFKMPLFYVVAAIFLVMPAFNVTSRWPDNLSFNFYSGNTTSANIIMSQAAKNKLPLYLQHFCTANKGAYYFDFEGWCRHELRVDCYPDYPVFYSVCNHLRAMTQSDVKDLQLQLKPKRNLLFKP